ncbi:MAG: helical backbone metal receptor [Salibacteraceae bacterium]
MDENLVKDQLGRTLTLPHRPQRIVSLVPSQTELLFDLGLGDRVVGITKFCIHPERWFRTKTRIGGTKSVNLKKIIQCQPDLIIANKEENTESDINKLSEKYPIWISDIKSLESALEMIRDVGFITDSNVESVEIEKEVRSRFDKLSNNKKAKKVLYLIWKDPFMAAGRDTFINEMLQFTGFENAISSTESRYPSLSVDNVNKLNPELILLSSEPFPFKGKHTEEVKKLFPDIPVIEVDGERFSWYGSGLLKSPYYFEKLKSEVQEKFA